MCGHAEENVGCCWGSERFTVVDCHSLLLIDFELFSTPSKCLRLAVLLAVKKQIRGSQISIF